MGAMTTVKRVSAAGEASDTDAMGRSRERRLREVQIGSEGRQS